MRFVILTEGGNKYGLGHVARCVSFYDAIEKNGYDAVFVIQGDSSVVKLLGNRTVHFNDWHNNLFACLETYSAANVIIVDSYYLKQSGADILSKCNPKILVIEDFIRLNYTDSIIVDWSLGAEKFNCYINKEETNTYLLGVQYLALRKPFWNIKTKKRTKYNSLLITMGGSDVRNLSKDLVLYIKEHFPLLYINLVVGPAFSNTDELRSLKLDGVDLFFSPNEYEMNRIISKSDFAISGGGQTLYELYAMGISIIAIELIDNQHDELQEWRKRSMLKFAGLWNDEYLFENINGLILEHQNNPDNYSCNRCDSIDTQGVFRILSSVGLNAKI